MIERKKKIEARKKHLKDLSKHREKVTAKTSKRKETEDDDEEDGIIPACLAIMKHFPRYSLEELMALPWYVLIILYDEAVYLEKTYWWQFQVQMSVPKLL